jgi:asparagine synthase (glutamine-hydrolysing)
MCGITGIYKSNPSNDDLVAMTEAIKHRGPDAFGYYINDNVALGHRRLSILDLSVNGNQPMFSHCKRYVMVYNGEIYNYQEIASELQSQYQSQISFKSSSDSEVILEAYVKWGMGFIEKLNGMFAIAIYDTVMKELILVRDRMGIKPLFYYKDEKQLIFASELKAIREAKGLQFEINQDAIPFFLNMGFIPAPHTIYKNIYKLEAGYYLKINKSCNEKVRYWNINEKISEQVIKSEKEAIVKISDLLASSVQYQLKSDVPFGVFLSGGIDSSLITAQAVAIANTSINTFSIGFKEQKYNEAVFAEKIAHHLGTNHNEFIVSENDAIGLIEEVVDFYDEPFADSSAIPTMLVSKLARSKVTVTLSGEGGDELFMGYGSYKWARRLSNPLIKANKGLIRKVLSGLNDERYKRAAHLFDEVNEKEKEQHIFSQEQYYFSRNEINSLLKSCKGSYSLNVDQNYAREINTMEKQALFDMCYYLPGDLLTKVDRASMRYSLETRVPYLDHRLVELALNISPELKYKNGISKYILKEILYQYLPKEYFNRPKQGFAIPLSDWLRNDLSYLIDEYLNDNIVQRYSVVNHLEVIDLVKRFRSGEKYLYNRIWLLVVLHRWFSKNEDAFKEGALSIY